MLIAETISVSSALTFEIRAFAIMLICIKKLFYFVVTLRYILI